MYYTQIVGFSNKKYVTLRGINTIKTILITRTSVCMLRHLITREIIYSDVSKGPQLLCF